MANTYSKLNIHCVFAVKGRQNLITGNFRDDLHKYLSGIIKNNYGFPLAVGGWLDHVHVFYEMQPDNKISDMMRILKSSSSKWINESHFCKEKFRWQEGYGTFSYSRSQRDTVIKYIMSQEEHHKLKTFREEYSALLKEFEVDYRDEYLFEYYEGVRK